MNIFCKDCILYIFINSNVGMGMRMEVVMKMEVYPNERLHLIMRNVTVMEAVLSLYRGRKIQDILKIILIIFLR